MKFITVNTYEELSEKDANIIASQVILKPNSVIGLATDSSPLGIYTSLAAMNEAGCVDFSNVTSVNLDESTITVNARFFQSREDVPRQAITMGMHSIMRANKILLVANGEHKKAILEKAMFGPIDPQVPASILQLHPDVTVIYTNE